MFQFFLKAGLTAILIKYQLKCSGNPVIIQSKKARNLSLISLEKIGFNLL